MEIKAEGIIPPGAIAVIMAFTDGVAFLGGLFFVRFKLILGAKIKYLAPCLFFIGYIFLGFIQGWAGALIGSVCVGMANGAGIPYIIAEVTKKNGRSAGVTVMPFISAALYLGQFFTPLFLALIRIFCGDTAYLPYYTAIFLSLFFIIFSRHLGEED